MPRLIEQTSIRCAGRQEISIPINVGGKDVGWGLSQMSKVGSLRRTNIIVQERFIYVSPPPQFYLDIVYLPTPDEY
jgi:hypothetical protein